MKIPSFIDYQKTNMNKTLHPITKLTLPEEIVARHQKSHYQQPKQNEVVAAQHLYGIKVNTPVGIKLTADEILIAHRKMYQQHQSKFLENKLLQRRERHRSSSTKSRQPNDILTRFKKEKAAIIEQNYDEFEASTRLTTHRSKDKTSLNIIDAHQLSRKAPTNKQLPLTKHNSQKTGLGQMINFKQNKNDRIELTLDPVLELRPSQQYIDDENNSSESDDSVLKFRNFRIKTEHEIGPALLSRMHTSQKFAKPKLIILTEKIRMNMFKIKDRLSKKFENPDEAAEDPDLRDIFSKQNSSKHMFNFQLYFQQNYLSKNRGMQVNMSPATKERTLEFERKVHKIIEQPMQNLHQI